MLDEDARFELIGEPGGFGEFGIDLAEIHAAQIKLRKLIESKAFALFLLGFVPRLGKLLTTLFLKYARELAFKAAIGLPLGKTHAKKLLRAIGSDIGAQSLRIAFMEEHFLAIAAKRDEQANAGYQRKAFALAAVEHAENFGRAGVSGATKERQRIGIKLPARFVHSVKRCDRILELIIGRALNRFAASIDAIDITVADKLLRVLRFRKRALIYALPRFTGHLFGETFFAHKTAGAERFNV